MVSWILMFMWPFGSLITQSMPNLREDVPTRQAILPDRAIFLDEVPRHFTRKATQRKRTSHYPPKWPAIKRNWPKIMGYWPLRFATGMATRPILGSSKDTLRTLSRLDKDVVDPILMQVKAQ